jgi:hypothetical protein
MPAFQAKVVGTVVIGAFSITFCNIPRKHSIDRTGSVNHILEFEFHNIAGTEHAALNGYVEYSADTMLNTQWNRSSTLMSIILALLALIKYVCGNLTELNLLSVRLQIRNVFFK